MTFFININKLGVEGVTSQRGSNLSLLWQQLLLLGESLKRRDV
jgi:hypothetical protein